MACPDSGEKNTVIFIHNFGPIMFYFDSLLILCDLTSLWKTESHFGLPASFCIRLQTHRLTRQEVFYLNPEVNVTFSSVFMAIFISEIPDFTWCKILWQKIAVESKMSYEKRWGKLLWARIYKVSNICMKIDLFEY